MALENPESHSDRSSLGLSREAAPDSSPLAVSLNTQLESGIPPARARCASDRAAPFGTVLDLEHGVQRIEAALGNAQRSEASLGLLLRGLKHLAAGAEAVRTANTELMLELDELSAQLSRNREEEQAMRFRMIQLEQMLSLVRHEAARERRFLLEEQDRFLHEILVDHDRQLDELRHGLRARTPDPVDDEIEELIAQRDQAREYATLCERERDLAWQELAAGARKEESRAVLAAEPIQRSPSGAAAIGSISLRTVAVPASSVPADAARPTERPGTGYSLARDDISE